MAISSYPRTIVTGTGNTNNPQNGLCLMVFNSVTNRYDPVTELTFNGTAILSVMQQIYDLLNNGTAAVQIADPTTPTTRAAVNASNKLNVVI